jgi:hypothetical protein
MNSGDEEMQLEKEKEKEKEKGKSMLPCVFSPLMGVLLLSTVTQGYSCGDGALFSSCVGLR